METTISIILILGALLAGAISPGPSFLLVANMAMNLSRNNAIAASIGMGVGGVILSILALMGLHAVLASVPSLYTALKIFGGIYLIYLAYRLWRGASQDLVVEVKTADSNKSLVKSFLISLITQLSNPKAAIIYGGIFAALLPKEMSYLYFYILPPLVFIVETGWYLVVTFILSAPVSRAAYLRSKSLYDRLASGIMAGLSLKLLSGGSP